MCGQLAPVNASALWFPNAPSKRFRGYNGPMSSFPVQLPQRFRWLITAAAAAMILVGVMWAPWWKVDVREIAKQLASMEMSDEESKQLNSEEMQAGLAAVQSAKITIGAHSLQLCMNVEGAQTCVEQPDQLPTRYTIAWIVGLCAAACLAWIAFGWFNGNTEVSYQQLAGLLCVALLVSVWLCGWSPPDGMERMLKRGSGLWLTTIGALVGIAAVFAETLWKDSDA
jgi:hypothetical protein